MGSAARPGNDDFQAALFGAGRIFKQPRRSAMGRNDPGFMGNAQVSQNLCRMAHGFPIGLAAHNDPN